MLPFQHASHLQTKPSLRFVSRHILPHDSSEKIPARWCPSLLANLVHIIQITMVYGRYIYTYNGLKTNKHNWGGHHLVWIQTRFKPRDMLRMETLLQRAPMIWRDCDSHFSADPATEFNTLQCEMIILTVNFGLQWLHEIEFTTCQSNQLYMFNHVHTCSCFFGVVHAGRCSFPWPSGHLLSGLQPLSSPASRVVPTSELLVPRGSSGPVVQSKWGRFPMGKARRLDCPWHWFIGLLSNGKNT